MKKSVLEIYAMSVCFATIVCMLIALGIASYNVIEIVNPEFTMTSYEYNRHQTNDSYWKGRNIYGSECKDKQRPPEEELTKERLESYQRAIVEESRDGLQSLTKAVIVIFLDIVFLGIHWRIARRAREATT